MRKKKWKLECRACKGVWYVNELPLKMPTCGCGSRRVTVQRNKKGPKKVEGRSQPPPPSIWG